MKMRVREHVHFAETDETGLNRGDKLNSRSMDTCIVRQGQTETMGRSTQRHVNTLHTTALSYPPAQRSTVLCNTYVVI